MSNFTYQGGINTFPLAAEVSGGLLIEYSRSPDSYKVNKYTAIKKVEKPAGLYTRMRNDEQARLHDVNDYIWPFGADRPAGSLNSDQHEFLKYECVRYNFPWLVDRVGAENAVWDILAQKARQFAMKAMINRTYQTANVLQTGANWPSANTATATSLGGGTWDNATSTNPYIKKSIYSALSTIVQATNGAVQPKQMQLILSPTAALTIVQSQEFIDFLKQQSNSPQIIKGVGEFEDTWGLGDYLYGLNVVIEDSVYVTNEPTNTTRSASYIFGGTSALILSRPDAIVPAGGPSFSTCTLFMYEEMQVESFTDQKNRREEGGVTETFTPILTAGETGFYITGIHS